jgi:hypothetical protein
LGLVFFDGTEWTQVSLGPNPSGMWPSSSQLAVSGETALVITRYWSEADDALSEPAAWLVDADRAVHSVPPPLSADDVWMSGLTGSGDGYVLIIDGADPGTLTIWQSNDGINWSVRGESAPLGTAQIAGNLQSHRNRLFAVGQTLACLPAGEGGDCQPGVGIWSSADGVAWDRVMTTLGDPVEAYAVGSGPLGLAAVGQPPTDDAAPRRMYLSADGATWEQAGGLTLFDPTADFWWMARPVVGSDAILIPGSSYRETSGTERTFLVVGRLVDP